MGTLIILRGLPASGKSTWAKQWADEEPNRLRVNRDDLRYALFGRYINVDENLVTKVQKAAMQEAMRHGYDIVLDNTNLNTIHAYAAMDLAIRAGYHIQVKDFEITLEESITRDALRPDRNVGQDAITKIYKRYMPAGKLPYLKIKQPENKTHRTENQV
jgi:predicted kinase